MKELVEVIAKALVDNPDAVVVNESLKGDDTLIELTVAPADMGKVIGKQGRIAKSNPFRSQGRCLKGRQESNRRDSVKRRDCRRIDTAILRQPFS